MFVVVVVVAGVVGVIVDIVVVTIVVVVDVVVFDFILILKRWVCNTPNLHGKLSRRHCH